MAAGSVLTMKDALANDFSFNCRHYNMEPVELVDMKEAIRRNDRDLLHNLVYKKSRCDLAILGKSLLYASENGQDECVQILLNAGASANVHTSRGATPLIYAAKCGFEKVIRVLMKANCSVTRGMYGVRSTALHWAASMGNTDCVEVLLEHREIDPDAQTMHGLTALMFAVRRGEVEMTNLLLGAGADMRKADDYGQCSLHHAAVGGYNECAHILIKAGLEIDIPDGKGNTAVILATKENNVEMLQCLIKWGANVNVQAGRSRLTALHWASYLGKGECLNMLLEGGADINAVVKSVFYRGETTFQDGATCLHLAAQGGFAGIVKSLLNKSAPMEVCDGNRLTCLHYAAKYDNPECMKLLLSANMDPDIQLCKYHPTPLSLAIRAKSVGCTKYLIKANCSLNTRVYKDEPVSSNLETVTPFELAVDYGSIDIVKLLALAGCDLSILNIWVETRVLPLELQFNHSVLHWLLDELYTPKTLKQHCRNSIRRQMGGKALSHIGDLPLPVSILRFLDFVELDII